MTLAERIAVARDLTKSIYLAAAGVMGGHIARLEASEKLRRMNICRECEHYDEKLVRCKICKCKGRGMELKASVNVWKCPVGKWHAGTLDAPFGYCEKCAAIVESVEDRVATCINGHKRKI